VVDEVGLSNGSLDMWRTADDVLGARVLSNQVPYSLVNRTAEATILPFARANGRVVIAFSPLAQGLLSANYDRDNVPTDPGRQTNPLFLPENLDRASGLLETLRSVAKAHTATPAQIALAWVIRDPAVTAIPGAATVEQLEHNVAAADIDLSDAEHEALATAAAAFHPVSPPRSGGDRLRRWVADRVGR
jgi:aryl-alcohol dehydrogenase-like predicted oxidoreductase